MLKQKDDAVTGLTGGIEYLFKKNNVKYVKGKGSFTGPKSLSVALTAGGSEQIEAKNIVIATGSEVMDLPGVKRDEQHIVSSTGALSISKVPKNMLVIGGGVIGLELG
jgi:dihydrolipoamide dehydrogenase